MFSALVSRSLDRGAASRLRERLRSAGIVALAVAVSAVSISIIASGGAVFFEGRLLLFAACVAASGFLAARYPRAFGFPCLVGLGAVIALLGYCFLGLPKPGAGIPVGSVIFGSDGRATVRFAPSGERFTPVEIEKARSAPLRAEVGGVRMHGLIPVFGGSERVALWTVKFGDGSVVRNRRRAPIELFASIGVFRITEMNGVFTPSAVAVGSRVRIRAGGGEVLFDR